MKLNKLVSQGNSPKNISDVEQKPLNVELRSSNGAGLLKLAGIVKNAPVDASVNPVS